MSVSRVSCRVSSSRQKRKIKEKKEKRARSSFVSSCFRFSVVVRSSCPRVVYAGSRGESRVARKRSSYLAREHCRVTLVAFALGG